MIGFNPSQQSLFLRKMWLLCVQKETKLTEVRPTPIEQRDSHYPVRGQS